MRAPTGKWASTGLLVASSILLASAAAPTLVRALLKAISQSPDRALRVEPESAVAQATHGEGTVKVLYSILNVSPRAIELGDVATNCGCSVASISRKTLAPGERAVVEVLGTPPSAGSKAVNIVIETNDRSMPSVVMRLVMVGANRTPYVAFHSLSVSFGSISRNARVEPVDILVQTRETAGTPPWIGLAKSSIDGVEIRGGLDVENEQGDGLVMRSYRYTASLNHGLPPGDINGVITFLPGDGQVAVLTMPILGQLRPAFSAEPPALYAAIGRQSDPVRLKVEVVSDEFEFNPDDIEVEDSPPGIHIRRGKGEAGRVEFEVEIEPEGLGGPRSAIVFHTKNGSARVEVPVVLNRAAG